LQLRLPGVRVVAVRLAGPKPVSLWGVLRQPPGDHPAGEHDCGLGGGECPEETVQSHEDRCRCVEQDSRSKDEIKDVGVADEQSADEQAFENDYRPTQQQSELAPTLQEFATVACP
jgi:hypothetical protein